jgi:uncharacterized membrane protein (DUF373 family)
MSRWAKGVLAVHNGVEKTIVLILLAVLMVVLLWVAFSFGIDLVRLVAERIFTGERIDIDGLKESSARLRVLHDVFGSFLLILIGVELMKTIAMYLSSHEVHVEVVFTVAIIAVVRHVIDLDVSHLDGLEMLGLSALVVALTLGYLFFRKAAALPSPKPPETKTEPPRKED